MNKEEDNYPKLQWHERIKASVCVNCVLFYSCKGIDASNKCTAFSIFNFLMNQMKEKISYHSSPLKFVYDISEMILSTVITDEKNLFIKNWDTYSAQICQECHLPLICKGLDPNSECEAFTRIKFFTRFVHLFEREVEVNKRDFCIILEEAIKTFNKKKVISI